MNASFLKLNTNTKIVETQNQNSKNDAATFLSEARQMMYSPPFTGDEGNHDLKQDKFHNCQEIFVTSIGETGSNELKFYYADDYSIIQRLELTQEGCVYLTAHSKTHFSIFLVTNNGSLFLWSVRPAKIIQPLAPYFTEIEENKEYVEKEDEFDKQLSDSEEEIKEELDEEERRKRKLAKIEIDILTIPDDHLMNFT